MRVDQLIEALQEIPDQYLEVKVSGNRSIKEIDVKFQSDFITGNFVNIELEMRG